MSSSYREEGAAAPTGGGDGEHSSPEPVIRVTGDLRQEVGAVAANDAGTEPNISTLYPVLSDLSPTTATAFSLLIEGDTLLGEALELLTTGNQIQADDKLHHLFEHLTELFCVRQIGDGFGTVISACMASIENLQGSFPSYKQLVALRTAVQALIREPFMGTKRADELLDKLEAACFVVEPAVVEVLADWLSDDRVS